MVEIIESTDIPADLAAQVDGSQLVLMLAGLNARAVRVAPCLGGTGDAAPTADQLADAKLVLMSALERWITDGVSAVGETVVRGPFTKTTQPQQPTRTTGYRLWPSEINDLQAICKRGAGIGTIGTYRGDLHPHRMVNVDPFTGEWFG
jgi:hypothetical protein